MTKILGIETTCDETAAAVVQDSRLVLSNIVASQSELHSKYGGIVPEVASRKHLEMLPLVVDEALEQAGFNIDELQAIAIASSPGLPTALSVGYAYASGLALANQLPLIEVDHLEGHMSGIWLVDKEGDRKKIPYPFICLLVSGGHTEIRFASSDKNYEILGQTRDDAAGEAFDKVARMLGLGYPGGPVIDKLAKSGNESAFDFPRPMLKTADFDFSFSGLKTAVAREVEKSKNDYSVYEDNKLLHQELRGNYIVDVAASFQEAAVEVLVSKTIRAAANSGVNAVAIAGGVSANSRLREQMARMCLKNKFQLYYPKMQFCTDNAAMIAARGGEMY